MRGVERREGQRGLRNIQTRDNIGTGWFFPPVLNLNIQTREDIGTGCFFPPVLNLNI